MKLSRCIAFGLSVLSVATLPLLGQDSSPTVAATPPSALGSSSGPAGTNLFNGRDLDGWQFITLKGATLESVAHVTPDGILSVTGKPTGYLLAPGKGYADYRLHVEYRWVHPKGNSGVFVHVTSGPRNGKAWPTCLQIQNRDQHTGELIPMGGFTFDNGPPDGKIFALRHPPKELPVGEWNSCDILCHGPSVTVVVNGVEQNKATGCSASSGGIALQLEGYPFEIRALSLQSFNPAVGQSKTIAQPTR